MSEREEDITNKLRAQSQEFQLPVDDFVWDAIEAGIAEPPQRKKRGLIWLFIFAGLLTTSLVLAFFSQNFSEKNQTARLNSSKNILTKSDPSSFNQIISQQNEIESLVVDEKASAIYTAHFAQNQLNKNKTSNQEKTKVESHSSTSWGQVKKYSSESGSLIKNDPLPSEKIETTPTINLAENQLENSQNQDSIESTADDANDADVLVAEKSDSTKNDENTNNVPQPDSTKIVAKTAKEKLPFKLLAYGGLGESFRTLKSDSQTLLVDHKNAHETYSACYELGLLADFGLSQTLFIRTGVSYKFYSEKYDFQHDLITHRTKNDYQYFQVPLRLGWNVLQTKRSTLGLIGGIQANVLFSAQSSWVDPTSFTPIAHNTLGTSSPFRSMTGAVN
ncbi:MAG: hypothetical protein IT222_05845, partial [Crocinitomix sp.]|nr:hypothetical protein [Crocinitomix sp.]